MRRQSGTTDLRALLYMDEVAGYLPPTANPPTKKPIMLLMKQARAFGLGVVLSTQNPVDIDYKAVSNAGTWMIGRLTTENDKARLLEGMMPPGRHLAGDFGAGQATVPHPQSRQNDVEQFGTKWARSPSYLRGPDDPRSDRAGHGDRTARVPTSPGADRRTRDTADRHPARGSRARGRADPRCRCRRRPHRLPQCLKQVPEPAPAGTDPGDAHSGRGHPRRLHGPGGTVGGAGRRGARGTSTGPACRRRP